jgi:acetyl-CoA carboxylase biotin carboxyl carrier protein
MESHEIDARVNGKTSSQPPGSRAVGKNTVSVLGQELAELARSLSGSLHRLSVRSGDCQIEVEWHTPSTGAVAAAEVPPAASVADDEVATLAVRAPLVGTYFAAPAPDADPFVHVGDAVERGQTLAIIEAMKMMNNVVADEPGVVSEILVSNGEPVEFDQPLVVLLPRESSA